MLYLFLGSDVKYAVPLSIWSCPYQMLLEEKCAYFQTSPSGYPLELLIQWTFVFSTRFKMFSIAKCTLLSSKFGILDYIITWMLVMSLYHDKRVGIMKIHTFMTNLHTWSPGVSSFILILEKLMSCDKIKYDKWTLLWKSLSHHVNACNVVIPW